MNSKTFVESMLDMVVKQALDAFPELEIDSSRSRVFLAGLYGMLEAMKGSKVQADALLTAIERVMPHLNQGVRNHESKSPACEPASAGNEKVLSIASRSGGA